MRRRKGPGGGQAEGGFFEAGAVWPWAHSSPIRPLESGPEQMLPRLGRPCTQARGSGCVGCWWAHLARVEFCVGVREAGELPGAAVEVDVAGPKGGEEAQMVVHWETRVGVRGASPVALSSAQPSQLQA